MKGSPFEALAKVPVLILAAGHGGKDSGACSGPYREADEAIVLVELMAGLLRPVLGDAAVVIAPHAQDTHETIPWINARYKFGEAWAIEIHRDSADTIKEPDASLRCGIYHGSSQVSVAIAAHVLTGMKARGAHGSSWTRDHHECRLTRWAGSIKSAASPH